MTLPSEPQPLIETHVEIPPPERPYNVSHGKLRVPWVTRWSAERRSIPNEAFHGAMLLDDEAYPGEASFSIILGRDDLSDDLAALSLREGAVVWWPEDNAMQGNGLPEFSQISATRQRQSIRRGLCQVCAMPVVEPGSGRPLRWFMPVSSAHSITPSTLLTQSPPVCSDCIPVARKLCPHIQANDWVCFIEPTVLIYGVEGHVVIYDPETQEATQSEFGLAPYQVNDEGRVRVAQHTSVVAKQQVVMLANFTGVQRGKAVV